MNDSLHCQADSVLAWGPGLGWGGMRQPQPPQYFAHDLRPGGTPVCRGWGQEGNKEGDYTMGWSASPPPCSLNCKVF